MLPKHATSITPANAALYINTDTNHSRMLAVGEFPATSINGRISTRQFPYGTPHQWLCLWHTGFAVYAKNNHPHCIIGRLLLKITKKQRNPPDYMHIISLDFTFQINIM
jgi:hypothetical protein